MGLLWEPEEPSSANSGSHSDIVQIAGHPNCYSEEMTKLYEGYQSRDGNDGLMSPTLPSRQETPYFDTCFLEQRKIS